MKIFNFSLLFLFGACRAMAGVFLLSDSAFFDPFIIVHPTGYTGAGGALEVKICTTPGSGKAVPALMTAIATWNSLTPTVQNCNGCRLWEEGPSGLTPPVSMESILIHELGHCAMGIDHVNWITSPSDMSFTNTKDVSSFNVGADGVRGSKDDSPLPLPGSRILHWFRLADNDPFVIDNAVIDSSTYTRRILDLPSGHSWPASGNRGVGDLIGLQNSQSVMYSGFDLAQVYSGLTADDVNTVKYGMTGVDELAGTSDDYSVQLTYTSDCASADIEVQLLSFGMEGGTFGTCDSFLLALPTSGLQIHHTVVPVPFHARIELRLNADKKWNIIFVDGFETGDLSQWATP